MFLGLSAGRGKGLSAGRGSGTVTCFGGLVSKGKRAGVPQEFQCCVQPPPSKFCSATAAMLSSAFLAYPILAILLYIIDFCFNVIGSYDDIFCCY